MHWKKRREFIILRSYPGSKLDNFFKIMTVIKVFFIQAADHRSLFSIHIKTGAGKIGYYKNHKQRIKYTGMAERSGR